MRFLCLSDIHGNARAFRTVLEAASALEVWDALIVCGDLVYPGPEPLETWKLLLEHKALCVQGPSDRALATLDPKKLLGATAEQKARIERLRRTHEELGQLIITRLGRLETMARLDLDTGDELVITHGSPRDPFESLSAEMTDDELAELIGDDPGDVFLCGGSHVPFERKLDETTLVVNVGSVGDSPSKTHADATFLETSPGGVIVRQMSLAL